ncbi:MAG: hypothetical protein J6T91_02950 [Alphaproteobacteria bacterium]|nr:hypothetical protein [Alphaproteobacteria bacterium]
MKKLVLVLFLVFSSSNADFNTDFSVEDIKDWFGEVYQNVSSKVETGIDKLKSSSAVKKMGDLLTQAEDTLRENRSGTVTSEFLEASKNLADRAAKLNKELDEDIRSLSQLKEFQYKSRVITYKDGKQYVTALEECLKKELDNFVDAKAMKEEVKEQMDNILNILTDELIYSYMADLREAYNTFNDAFEKMEDKLKSEK